jgi:hypothetical protein
MKKLKINSSMIYKCLAVVAFAFILTANIVINKGPNKTTDITLSQLSAKADEAENGGEVAICLEVFARQTSYKEVDLGGDCWVDTPGADINEGAIYNCNPASNSSCNRTECKYGNGCYYKYRG